MQLEPCAGLPGRLSAALADSVRTGALTLHIEPGFPCELRSLETVVAAFLQIVVSDQSLAKDSDSL
jgi:hypothetical protein